MTVDVKDTLKTIRYELGEVRLRTMDGLPLSPIDDKLNDGLMDEIWALQEEAKAMLAEMNRGSDV